MGKYVYTGGKDFDIGTNRKYERVAWNAGRFAVLIGSYPQQENYSL